MRHAALVERRRDARRGDGGADARRLVTRAAHAEDAASRQQRLADVDRRDRSRALSARHDPRRALSHRRPPRPRRHGRGLPRRRPQAGPARRAQGRPQPRRSGRPEPRRRASSAQASRAASGFSAGRLARLDRVLQQDVDDNRVAGVVALVLRGGQPAYERALGWSDKEASRRMTTDAIFRIASQSKALTSVVILSLMEEGTLTLNTPLSRFIPAFSKATGARSDDVTPRAGFVPERHEAARRRWRPPGGRG